MQGWNQCPGLAPAGMVVLGGMNRRLGASARPPTATTTFPTAGCSLTCIASSMCYFFFYSTSNEIDTSSLERLLEVCGLC